MALEKPEKDLEEIAANVVESLEDLIQVMQDAADHVSLRPGLGGCSGG